MKHVVITFILAVVCGQSFCDSIISKFLFDFFHEKNVMMTVSTCWNTGEIKTFLKLISFIEKPKQVAVHTHKFELERYTSHLSHNNYFVLDLNLCEAAWLLIEQVNKMELFRAPFKYLILTKNMEELTEKLKNYSIYPASELVIGEIKEHDMVLHQPYRTDSDSDIIWDDYGFWSEYTGLIEYNASTPLSRRRHNLRQVKLNVIFVVTDNDTWSHLDDFRYPRIDTFTKYDYGTTRSLLDYCNVNATYVGTNFFGYYINETGEWNGMVNELYHKRADLSGSGLYFTSERFEKIDYIKALNPATIKFLLKKPSLSFVRNIFVLAFESSLWLFVGIITSLSALVLFSMLNLETKYSTINSQRTFSWTDITLIIFEAICQQGTTTEPKRYSSRIATLIIFMNFMFIYVSYSAYIVVLLQSQTEIKTHEHLLETPIEVGCVDINFMKFYLTETKDDVLKQLYEKKIKSSGYYSLEDGMVKVRKGFFAFHVILAAAFDYILKYFTNYEICSLQELDGFVPKLQPHTGTPKNSPYKEIFKSGLLKVEECGIQKRNFLRYVIKPKCYDKGSSFETVGIVDTFQCLLVFVYGLLFSVTICVIENLVNHFKNKARSK